MHRTKCSKCSNEFLKKAEDTTTICQTCDNDPASDILVLQIFKWIFYSMAILALFIFINLAFAKENAHGYTIPGKGNSVISKERFNTLRIAIPIAMAGFGLVGFYLGIKEKKKRSV